MKTITTTTESGETYELTYETYLGKHLIAVNRALSTKAELMPSAMPTVEMHTLVKSIEVIKAVGKSWNQRTEAGDELPITDDTILMLPPQIIAEWGFQIQNLPLKPKTQEEDENEVAAAKN